MSEEFLTYCEKHGIGRPMTYPNTPQQNGIAERKLAHLTVVCLSWLHDKSVAIECNFDWNKEIFSFLDHEFLHSVVFNFPVHSMVVLFAMFN